MGRPAEAYREGYDKGRTDNAGGVLAQVTMGMLRDDPGGHYASGYHDGAAGKAFRPPSESVRKADAELNPFDDKVAIRTTCPNCGEQDWFEWKFLGKLKDPVCGHAWHAGSGTYALMQVRAAFGAGKRFSKYITSGESSWIGKAFGWSLGTILGLGIRLEFGILMIPIQAASALLQSNQPSVERTTRIVVLAVTLAAIAIGVYGTRQAATPQQQPAPVTTGVLPLSSQPSRSTSTPPVSPGGQMLLSNDSATASNWTKISESGTAHLALFNPHPMEIQAQPTNPPSGMTLVTSQIFTDDVEATFVLNHQGFGRTTVGLWSVANNNWAVAGVLDTNDTNFLSFSAGGPGTEWKYPGLPYMNRWISIQIRIVGSIAQFSVDGVHLENMTMLLPGACRLAVGVGCVSWKSGANDTLIRSISVRRNTE